MSDRLTVREMKQRLPTVTAKTELVLLDDAMYERDGDGWVRLQGEADLGNGDAAQAERPCAAPVSTGSPSVCETAGG